MMKGHFLPSQCSISRRFHLTTAILGSSDIRTDYLFETYIRTVIFPNITDAEYQAIAEAYPSDVTQGSPFGTGTLNALTPEFKRLAAFDGDFIFQAPRRLFLNQLSDRQKAWSFCKRTLPLPRRYWLFFLVSKRQKSVPVFGSVSIERR